MLSYALAIVVAISSLVLFSTAFFMSKIHRRDDFLWSAVGLFYALVLWYCARNITGAVLLGQAAATVLLVSYSWQTIKLRRIIAEPEKAVAISNFSVVRSVNSFWKRKKPSKPQPEVAPAPTKPEMPTVTESEIAIPETPVATPTLTMEVPPAATPKDSFDKAPQVVEEVTAPQANVVEDAAQNATVPQVDTPDKKLETQPTTNLPPVGEPATETKANPTSKPLVDIEIIDKATSAEPLPNKLPEADKIEAEDNLSSQPEIATDKLPATIENEPNAAPPVEEVESKPVINPEAETKKTASPFDSLETVEVAEVLEAQSDRESNNLRGDRSNEIEVTATDVDIIPENQKIDRNQQGESDSNDR